MKDKEKIYIVNKSSPLPVDQWYNITLKSVNF